MNREATTTAKWQFFFVQSTCLVFRLHASQDAKTHDKRLNITYVRAGRNPKANGKTIAQEKKKVLTK